jgi:hypothetical protein
MIPLHLSLTAALSVGVTVTQLVLDVYGSMCGFLNMCIHSSFQLQLCDQISMYQVAESIVLVEVHLCTCIIIPCNICSKCQYQSKSDILHLLLC